MMLDEKVKLEAYFKEEIQRISDLEIQEIEADIAQIKADSMAQLEEDARKEAGAAQLLELKELSSEHAIQLSKLREETSRKLMEKRKELCNRIFDEVKTKLAAFVSSDAYASYLKNKIEKLRTHDFGNVTFYVGKRDERLFSMIRETYGECLCEVDENITIGGFRMECKRKAILVDESIDSSLEDAKEWFYTNSGLFIR